MFGKEGFFKAGFLVALMISAVAAYGKGVDLAVSPSDIVISPQPPTDAAPLTLTVTVHNNGTKASKANQVSAKLLLSGKKLWSQKLPLSAVPPGGTLDVVFSLGTRPQGTYSLTAKADPANTISESNESNNKATAPLTVVAAGNADVGQAAAAAYWATYGVVSPVLSAQKIISRPSAHAEDVEACTKSGAVDATYAVDNLLRPLSVTLNSPATGYTDCEDWIDEYTTDPPTGLYLKTSGHMSADVTGYLSNNPLDPGFFLPASLILKLGDGNPGSDSLPDWTYSDMEDYLDSGSVQTREDKRESWDMTANVTVSGYSTLGYPTQMTLSANGTGEFYDPQTGRTSVMTLTNLVIQAAYSGTPNDLTITLTIDGGTATSFPDDPSLDYSITYHNLSMVMQETPQQITVSIDGSMDIAGACVSGTFTFATPEPVVYNVSNVCPNAGRVVVTSPLGNATLIFNADGSISVDNGSDGTVDATYPSCLVMPQSPC